MDSSQDAKWTLMQQSWSAGNWERMESLGKELLVGNPHDPDLLSAVGLAIFQQDRREEAKGYFTQAIANDPDHAESHSRMGWYWLRKKKYAKAEECVRRAISIEASDEHFWIQLGRILLVQGNTRVACKCAERALALDAGNVEAIALHTEAESRSDGIGTATPEEREQRLEAALGLEPDNADLHEALGEALEDQGRLREAEERYRESLALDPSRPWLWSKVRRMGLKRDWIDNILSAPWRFGLWLIGEGEFITLFLGLISCAVWVLVCAPISFLYRLLFRVELELLAARGTREVSISPWRRALRFVLLGIAGAVYWTVVWWVVNQENTWWLAGWALRIFLMGLILVCLYWSIRQTISESRHRRTLREFEEE